MKVWMDASAIKALVILIVLPVSAILLFKVVKWAKKMPKGAYLFLALMPLISLFPIPPPVFNNVAKAKQEQRTKRSKAGKK